MGTIYKFHTINENYSRNNKLLVITAINHVDILTNNYFEYS